MHFTYSNTTKIQFGQDQIKSISDLIETSQKVLVIYGGGSIKNNGVYEQVQSVLIEHQWIEFSGVEPNPSIETLDKAVQLCKTENIGYILAVGGGSVIDGAKYVAAASCYEGQGWDILIGQHQVTQALPIGAILTLPATGSESNSGSVITRKASNEKLPFMSPFVQPKFAVMDPDVMKTLPERQLINGIVDAWVHTCEQYITLDNNTPIQDGYAETLLKTLQQLGDDFELRDNDAWRANLMWSANQALNGLIGAGVAHDWATHMIGHELTAMYGVDHARSLAIVQPALLRNQIESKRQMLEKMGRNVFALAQSDDLAEICIDKIEAFYQGLNVATQFSDYKEDKVTDIEQLLKYLEAHGMVALGETQSITIDKSREILEAAFV